MNAPYPALSLRLDLANGERLGPGKVALLNAIEEAGSISAASKSLGMSYPRAWKLVVNMNASFESPVVEVFQGGASRGGASLTDTGRQIIALYSEILSGADKVSQKQLARLAELEAQIPPNHQNKYDEG